MGKLGQGNKLEKWGEKAERIKKGKSGEEEKEEEEKVGSRIRQKLSAN